MSVSISAKLTLWANRMIALILALLLFLAPGIVRWYGQVRPLGYDAAKAIQIAFYCCSVAVALALWDMDMLLRRILKDQVFIVRNVKCIRRIRWYCFAVALICLPAAWFYPPLIFMVVIMSFLSLVISVVSSVMSAAVTIREENDLTI